MNSVILKYSSAYMEHLYMIGTISTDMPADLPRAARSAVELFLLILLPSVCPYVYVYVLVCSTLVGFFYVVDYINVLK